jgi:poly-D-alanine transfer protein DltD
MDYSALLTTEQKKAILEQRIAQFAAEAYQHDLNKKLAKDNEEAVTAADNALVTLEAAINLHQDELNKLGE